MRATALPIPLPAPVTSATLQLVVIAVFASQVRSARLETTILPQAETLSIVPGTPGAVHQRGNNSG